MCSFPPRIFLLSPARLDGKRAHLLFHPVTMFPVARALHSVSRLHFGDFKPRMFFPFPRCRSILDEDWSECGGYHTGGPAI
jgi:hypothetical protein